MSTKFDLGRNNKTERLVKIALFAAICFFGTWVHIPINIGGGTSMIHLGTTAIFLSAIFLGPDAAWAGGIGCALFDATNPLFVAWIIPTFIAKGLTGYVVGKVSHAKDRSGDNVKQNILSFLLGGVVSLAGYFLFNSIFFVGFYGAIAAMPTSIITTIIGVIITVPLMAVKPLVNRALNYNK